MERLGTSPSGEYSALEAAIHVGRYAPLMSLCAGRRVLDVACGEGYGSWLLARAGAAQVDGVDINREAVRAARATYRASNLTFRVADAGALAAKLGEARYNLVACIETIEHLRDPDAFLAELRAVMAEDCVVYVTCPNDHWYYAEDAGNPFHARKYRFEEFRELTEGVLGAASRWLFGTAALGFATVPLVRDDAGAPSPYVAARPLGAALLCPPSPADAVGPTVASYFVGVWNDPEARVDGGAFFPMSMNVYAEKENAVGQVRELMAGAPDATAQELARLSTDLAALREAVFIARGEEGGEAAALKQQNLALAISLRELEARFAADLAAGAERLAEAQHEAGRLLGRHEAALEEHARGRAAAEAERDSARGALAQAEVAAAEGARWRETGQSLRVQAGVLRAENDVLGESVAKWQAEAGRTREALSAEIRSIREIKDEEIAGLHTYASDLEAEIAKQNADLTKEIAKQKADLSGELDRLRDLVARREAELADRENDLRAKGAEAAMRAVLVDRAERELAAARHLVAAARRLVPRRRFLALRSGRSEAVRRGVLALEAAVAELGAWPPGPENVAARQRLIAASSLFDPNYYLAQNPDIAEAGADPLDHFVILGGAEGRRPSPDFDSAAYLRANPDIAEAGENPLVHYLLFGAAEGRPLRDGAEGA